MLDLLDDLVSQAIAGPDRRQAIGVLSDMVGERGIAKLPKSWGPYWLSRHCGKVLDAEHLQRAGIMFAWTAREAIPETEGHEYARTLIVMGLREIWDAYVATRYNGAAQMFPSADDHPLRRAALMMGGSMARYGGWHRDALASVPGGLVDPGPTPRLMSRMPRDPQYAHRFRARRAACAVLVQMSLQCGIVDVPWWPTTARCQLPVELITPDAPQ